MNLVVARLTSALAGHYRIDREIGAGGMATVYLAHDLRHERDVAIKVLHPDLGAALGGERFLSEIRTTARLQHPHILPLLDSGEADGLLYYVMPLVTGETLRARLERERQLPVAEAVRIAREVAGALDYAHRQNIIHRDIKPENVLLHDGSALVADFGIALAVQSAGGQRMTQTGLSLGTPSYMSPEQAMGERVIDARSDVYALGAMTYEMLAGEPPFTGPTVQAIVAKVMSTEPAPIASLRKAVPAHVASAVHSALEKLPADRCDSARAFADALTNPVFAVSGSSPHSSHGSASSATTRWRLASALLAVVAIAAAAVATQALTRGTGSPRDIGLPPLAPMRMEDVYRNFAVAHDGSFIVYEAKVGETSQLWYQSLVTPDGHAIAGTDGAFGTPRIAPDDKRVAFGAGTELKVVAVAGGTATPVAKARDMQGGEWLANGQIFFSDDDGRTLRWVDPDGGPARSEAATYCIWPFLLRAGDRALCGGGAEKAATVMSLGQRVNAKRYLRRAGSAGDAAMPLVVGANFRIVDERYLVYMGLDGTLLATTLIDRDSLTVGKSVALEPMVRRVSYSGAGQFDLTADGTLVYVPGTNAEAGRLVRWSGPGRVAALPFEPAVYLRWSVSPDGRRLAAVVQGVEQEELRIVEMATGKSETIEQGFYVGGMSWSPDGQRLVYRMQVARRPDAEQLLMRQLDSPAAPRVLVASDVPMKLQPSSFFGDDFLLVGAFGSLIPAHVINLGASPARADTLPLRSYFVAASPDRRWLAHQGDGTVGITVQPYPALDRRYLVDAQGHEPQWRSPTELVYFTTSTGGAGRERQSFSHVMIDPRAATPVGTPETLFNDPRFTDTPGWSYAVAPGGDIIYLQATAEGLGHYVRVVPNWVREMKRAVDAANK